MVASLETYKSTLLNKWIAPVRNFPAGTTTRPPPAAWQAAIAFWNASVQSVVPSPTALYFVMRKSWLGNWGGTIRCKISGTCAQAEALVLSGTAVSAACAKMGTRKRQIRIARQGICINFKTRAE